MPAGLALQRPKVDAVPVEFTGEGQMQLNSLHMAEVLTDDSNFRQRAMDSLAAPMAHALSQPPQDFASAWLAGSTADCAVLHVTAVHCGAAVKAVTAIHCVTTVKSVTAVCFCQVWRCCCLRHCYHCVSSDHHQEVVHSWLQTELRRFPPETWHHDNQASHTLQLRLTALSELDKPTLAVRHSAQTLCATLPS